MSSTKRRQRKIDVDQVQRLELLLRFARTNLEKMTARELVQLGRKIAIFLHYYELGEDFSVIVPPKVIDRLVGRQGEELRRLQARITEFLQAVVDMDSFKFPSETEYTCKLRLEVMPDQTLELERKAEPAGILRFKTSVEVSPDERGVLYHLIQALNGVPTSWLERCSECRGWFLHRTERPRKFCSHLCGARASRRTRYQEIKAKKPKLYKAQLEEGRKRARKSALQKTGRNQPLPDSSFEATSEKEEA